MRKIKGVIGFESAAKPIVTFTNEVFVHTNIKPHGTPSSPDGQMYIYDEIQYTKDEYIEVQSNTISELSEQVTTLQLAIVELYEIQAAMQQQLQQQLQMGGVE